jgi:DNA gyrase/topoisomerase IV subunit B
MRFNAPKLIDCVGEGRNADRPTELFIVEGDSAARSVKRVRDGSFQAILPMQGKPMNAVKSTLDDLKKNVQFAALFSALGIDLASPNQEEDIRYENIILLFDPDADGIHARTLMLLFFHKWMRWWLDAGRIHDAHAPQWEIVSSALPQPAYAATPDHLQRIREQLRNQGATDIRTRRFRGIGGVDGLILKKRCVDPSTRQLTTLSAAHAETAIDVFRDLRSLGAGRSARQHGAE